MRLIYLPLCAVALIFCGCDKDTQSRDEKEEHNALLKSGQSYIEIKDWNKAEEAFKHALEVYPEMARPHLDLALIYQQYKLNYIHAIYHYDRYLELRPDAEKAGFIEEQRTKVEQVLAHNYIKQSKDVQQMLNQYKRLQQENTELKRQLASSRKPAPVQVATRPTPVTKKTVTETVPKSTTPTGSAKHQIYTVVAGDNLTKIAKKFYTDGDYEPIYQANKDRMKSPRDLQVGQTLVIPTR